VSSLEITSDWNCNNETSVQALLRKHLDCSTQGDCKTFGDEETETDTFFVDGLVLLHYLAKEFKKALDVFLTDADSGVVNLEVYGFLYGNDVLSVF